MRARKSFSTGLVAFAGIALIGLQACADGSPTALRTVTESAVAPVTVILESDQSGIQDSRRLVIRDEATWAAVWAELEGPVSGSATMPKIDFSREMVLVATLGTKPTGGYTISFGQTIETDAEITAFVRKEMPGMKCGTTEMVTHPFSVVSLARSDLPVRFVETEEIKDCG